MRIYKKVMVPAREEERVSAVVCDICKHSNHMASDNHCGGVEWGGTFDVAEVNISIKEGSQYPESGSGTLISFDVCPRCFQEKLVPYIVSLGGIPKEEDWYI